MPEGPEVAYMAKMLQNRFRGTELRGIKIRGGRYKRHGLPTGLAGFLRRLPRKIVGFGCKGKYLYIRLEGDWVIGVTLGLTGHFVLEETTHSHYLFETSRGKFYMEDMRNFGTISVMKIEDLEKRLEKIGPDMLGAGREMNLQVFQERLMLERNLKKQIALVLLDQSVVSGIGNYIRSESFYRARISPFRKVGDLSKAEVKRLYMAVRGIIRRAYQYAVQKKRFYRLFSVYKQKITPKGEEVIHEKDSGGRYLYYVK